MIQWLSRINNCENRFLNFYCFIHLCWIVSLLKVFGQINSFFLPDKGASGPESGHYETWTQPGLGSDTHLLCDFDNSLHCPEPLLPCKGWVGWSLGSCLTFMVLSSVTLNYCHLPVGGIASGCFAVFWTSDTSLGLPSTCPSDGAGHPCRLAKAMQISLTEKEMPLCKRENFNIVQNSEPQNLHRDSSGCEHPLLLKEASLSD